MRLQATVGIQLDDTGYSCDSFIGERKVDVDPIARNGRICIGIGQPDRVRIDAAKMLEDCFHSKSSCATGGLHTALEDPAERAQLPPRDLRGGVSASVRNHDDPKRVRSAAVSGG